MSHFDSRLVASPGRIHLGLSEYPFTENAEIKLHYELTIEQARTLAEKLHDAADKAEAISDVFPRLVPVDDTKAIEANAAVI